MANLPIIFDAGRDEHVNDNDASPHAGRDDASPHAGRDDASDDHFVMIKGGVVYRMKCRAFPEIRALSKNKKELSLHSFSLNNIPDNLPNELEKIDLSNNFIRDLPKIWPKNLKELSLGSNYITEFSENNNIESLEILHLSYNNIEIIDIISKSIKKLYINNNPIKDIRNIPKNLILLSLSNTGISEIPILPKTIESFYANSNSITQIISENNFEVFTKTITELDLSYNSIETIPDNLSRTLRVLNLSYNKIKTIPEYLPDGLKILDLSHNMISIIPKYISHNLELLDLSHNRIEIIPKNLPRNTIELYILDNPLKYILNENGILEKYNIKSLETYNGLVDLLWIKAFNVINKYPELLEKSNHPQKYIAQNYIYPYKANLIKCFRCNKLFDASYSNYCIRYNGYYYSKCCC